MFTHSHNRATSTLLPARQPARLVLAVFTGAKFVARWMEARRQLRALSDLNDDLLRDVGLSREDVDHACSTPLWRFHPAEALGAHGHGVSCASRSALLLVSLLVASGATRAVSQEICKPRLSAKAAGHSDVVNFQRKWTAGFAVDASRCSTTTGSFDIEFVRLKEVGPDLAFTERFAWTADKVDVSLDLTWDEWVDAYRVRDVAPCPCR
jgi:uncharacterized protein YjiS (DUF1127 family)